MASLTATVDPYAAMPAEQRTKMYEMLVEAGAPIPAELERWMPGKFGRVWVAFVRNSPLLEGGRLVGTIVGVEPGVQIGDISSTLSEDELQLVLRLRATVSITSCDFEVSLGGTLKKEKGRGRAKVLGRLPSGVKALIDLADIAQLSERVIVDPNSRKPIYLDANDVETLDENEGVKPKVEIVVNISIRQIAEVVPYNQVRAVSLGENPEDRIAKLKQGQKIANELANKN